MIITYSFQASLQRHLDKLPSTENGEYNSDSSDGELSDNIESSNNNVEANELLEKVFRGYDLKGFSFPPPSTATKTLNDNAANGIGE